LKELRYGNLKSLERSSLLVTIKEKRIARLLHIMEQAKSR